MQNRFKTGVVRFKSTKSTHQKNKTKNRKVVKCKIVSIS